MLSCEVVIQGRSPEDPTCVRRVIAYDAERKAIEMVLGEPLLIAAANFAICHRRSHSSADADADLSLPHRRENPQRKKCEHPNAHFYPPSGPNSTPAPLKLKKIFLAQRLRLLQPMSPDNNADNLCLGAVAGTLATVPMSVAMLALDQYLDWGDFRDLPPKQITKEMGRVIDSSGRAGELTCDAVATVAHFGYGATMGGLFGVLCGTRSHAIAKGIGFGLGVWAGSYLGWLPAVRSRAAAHQQGLKRNIVMIASHLVWGASVGYAFDRLSATQHRKPTSPPDRTRRNDGHHAVTSPYSIEFDHLRFRSPLSP